MQAVVGQPLALVLGQVGGKGLMGNEMICSVFFAGGSPTLRSARNSFHGYVKFVRILEASGAHLLFEP